MNNLFASLYESAYYSNLFSNAMFQNGLFGSIGLWLILISVALAVFFYYLINRPGFSRWGHWLIILLIDFLINFIIGIALPMDQLSAKGFQFSYMDIVPFAFFNALYAAICFVIVSFIIRWWSTHAKGTPIPN